MLRNLTERESDMTSDERNLLLILAGMMLQTHIVTHDPEGNTLLREAILRIRVADERTADEEKHLARG